MKFVGAILLFFATFVSAKTISRDDALRVAFPGAKIRPSVVFLTEQEKQEVKKISGADVTTALVACYIAEKDGKESGRAYLDTHVVRTKKESLLVILKPDGTLQRVEVVAFLEPPEYMPSERWYQQFEGQALDESLNLERDIHVVTGATLTARATTEAVRRVMAIDTILQRKRK